MPYLLYTEEDNILYMLLYDITIKQICIDSRFKTVDSVCDSNFKISLGRNLFLPVHTVTYLEDVVIPHSWWTINENVNDKVYIQVNGGTIYQRSLTAQQYTGDTFRDELASKLADISFGVAYNNKRNQMTISNSTVGNFKILSDYELNLKGVSSDPQSCNEVLGVGTGNTSTYSPASPFVSNNLNMSAYNNLYISCPNLTSYSALNSNGSSDVIKKVPVNSDFGYLAISPTTQDHDYLDCSKMTVNTLEFHVKDAKGQLIPLHGGHASFSIVFDILENGK